jgi:serine/threonine protein kinase
MGVVLKGYDRELHRYVAIKVLAPHLAHSALARKRFAREAQAAATVVDLHVLAIHHVQVSGRLPYLVMPLVAGESLAQRLAAQGTLELKEVLRVGMQAAAGLAAAHDQGLIHRDVKPANILLEKGVDRAVLTDFGLARAADDASMTRRGVIAGTPQYMSPEQARGEALDGRSDLFSLGCILYEMATGVSPFKADSAMATMRRLVDESPAALASLNPELPRWFVAIVGRLLEKDPARRFGSAREVSELLGGCLAHIQQPTSVPLPPQLQASPSADKAKSKRFPPKGVLVLLASLAIVLLGTVGWLLMYPGDDADSKERQSRTVHGLQSSVQESPTKKNGPKTDEPPTSATPAKPQSDQAPVASTKTPETDPGKMLLFGETDEYDAVINDAIRMLTKQKKRPGLLGYGKVTLNSAGKIVSIPIYKEGIVSKATTVVMGKFDDKKKKWVAGEPMQGAAGWDLVKEAGKVLQIRVSVAADKKTITNILIKNTDQRLVAASREFDALLKGVGPQTNGRGFIAYHKVKLDSKGSVLKKFPPTQGLVTKDTKVAMGKYDADKKMWEAGEDIPNGLFGDVFKNLKMRPVLVRMRLAEVPAPTGQENGRVVQILVHDATGSAER